MVELEEHQSSQKWQATASEEAGTRHKACQRGVNCTTGPFEVGKDKQLHINCPQGLWLLAQGNNKK